MSYTFEWDPEKTEANRRKHDVSFHAASTVFADLLAMLMHNPDHSVGEERHLVLGASSTGVVIRGESRRAAAPDTAHQRAASHPQREETL